MSKVIVVGCSSSKKNFPCKAEELYISPLFNEAKRVAKESGHTWYIFSAKYGLVKPDAILEPYDFLYRKNGGAASYRNTPVASKEERKVITSKANNILSDFSDRVYLMGIIYTRGLVTGYEPLEGLKHGARFNVLRDLKL